ncbi:hypothetical protein XELAEV_18042324mg [Pelobates cultripes]|uniref:CCHC-type domain-containing protein n=1 Tax=Pelobates cultripes TaxID=61616 RepID=A0AAD1TIN0_PELCU|nr:hypothetical protein XELAEV_18042324mg [Pelobates cultripes]
MARFCPTLLQNSLREDAVGEPSVAEPAKQPPGSQPAEKTRIQFIPAFGTQRRSREEHEERHAAIMAADVAKKKAKTDNEVAAVAVETMECVPASQSEVAGAGTPALVESGEEGTFKVVTSHKKKKKKGSAALSGEFPRDLVRPSSERHLDSESQEFYSCGVGEGVITEDLRMRKDNKIESYECNKERWRGELNEQTLSFEGNNRMKIAVSTKQSCVEKAACTNVLEGNRSSIQLKRNRPGDPAASLGSSVVAAGEGEVQGLRGSPQAEEAQANGSVEKALMFWREIGAASNQLTPRYEEESSMFVLKTEEERTKPTHLDEGRGMAGDHIQCLLKRNRPELKKPRRMAVPPGPDQEETERKRTKEVLMNYVVGVLKSGRTNVLEGNRSSIQLKRNRLGDPAASLGSSVVAAGEGEVQASLHLDEEEKVPVERRTEDFQTRGIVCKSLSRTRRRTTQLLQELFPIWAHECIGALSMRDKEWLLTEDVSGGNRKEVLPDYLQDRFWWIDKKEAVGGMRDKEEVTGIDGLSEAQSKEVWKRMDGIEIVNRQRDVAWMAVNNCLSTREVQYSRRLARSEMCPREGCGGRENIVHVLWNCEFVRECNKKLLKLVVGLTGISVFSYEVLLFGLCKLDKEKERVLWILMACIKETLWDARNLFVFKNERLSIDACVRMVKGKVYLYYLRDVRRKNEMDAEGVWKTKKWKKWLTCRCNRPAKKECGDFNYKSGCHVCSGRVVLKKFGLHELDRMKPYCFNIPWFYRKIEVCVKKYDLVNVSRDEWCETKRVFKLIRCKEEMLGIVGLSMEQSKEVWKRMNEMVNRQRDVAWMSVHNILPTREFQHGRCLARSDVCPREGEGCGGRENVLLYGLKKTEMEEELALSTPRIDLVLQYLQDRWTLLAGCIINVENTNILEGNLSNIQLKRNRPGDPAASTGSSVVAAGDQLTPRMRKSLLAKIKSASSLWRRGLDAAIWGRPALSLGTRRDLKMERSAPSFPKTVIQREILKEQDQVPLVIHMYNPFVTDEEIMVFLQRYCSVVAKPVKLVNMFGVYNGKRKVFVTLRPDPSEVSGLKHPPQNFSIGGNRGYLYYPGQPMFCRNCFHFGHLTGTYDKGMCCRNCFSEGHTAAECDERRRCDLCGSERHMAKTCPNLQREETGGEATAGLDGADVAERPGIKKPMIKSSDRSSLNGVIADNLTMHKAHPHKPSGQLPRRNCRSRMDDVIAHASITHASTPYPAIQMASPWQQDATMA